MIHGTAHRRMGPRAHQLRGCRRRHPRTPQGWRQACRKSNTLPDIIATASVIATTTINSCIINTTSLLPPDKHDKHACDGGLQAACSQSCSYSV